MNHSSDFNCDLIIVGAGIVGLTAALLAAEQQFSVAILEKKAPQFSWDPGTVDHRVSAITRNSQNIFQSLKLWENITQLGVSSYQKMTVWDAEGFGEIHFDAKEVQQPDLGHIIENRVMMKSLWEKAAQTPNIQFFVPATVTSLNTDKDSRQDPKPNLEQDFNKVPKKNSNKIIVQLDNGKKLTAPLLIGADGAQSWIRETLSMPTQIRDYEQTALVTTVTTEIPHQNTAWQRFLPEGPLAFLPLQSPNTCSIVWSSTTQSHVQRLMLNDLEFSKELFYAFDGRLGNILSVEQRHAFPLKSLYVHPPIAERVALMGDAARVIHPLAGQGINLGLEDALALVEILAEAKRKHFDLGHTTLLSRYARARKARSLSMIALMDFFQKSFGTKNSMIKILRSLTINGIDKNAWIKKKLINAALGISDSSVGNLNVKTDPFMELA